MEAWVPAGPAGSCMPPPPTAASPPPALTRGPPLAPPQAPPQAPPPRRTPPQALPLRLFRSDCPCSGPWTSGLGWGTRPASAQRRTWASCCRGDGLRSGFRCELQVRRCDAHEPPRRQAGGVLLPWQRGGREGRHLSGGCRGGWVGAEQQRAAGGGTHQRRRWAESEQEGRRKTVEEKTVEEVMEHKERKEWVEERQAGGGQRGDEGRGRTAERRVGGGPRGARSRRGRCSWKG